MGLLKHPTETAADLGPYLPYTHTHDPHKTAQNNMVLQSKVWKDGAVAGSQILQRAV